MAGLVGPLVVAAVLGAAVVVAVLFAVPARPASEPWKPCRVKGAAWEKALALGEVL